MRRATLAFFLALLVACGADEPIARPPPQLPACPRAIGSVYVPTKSFARAPFTAPIRPPMSAVVARCGGVKDPCPLQRWMRERLGPALAAEDSVALADALEALAGMSPEPEWEWSAIAMAASEAARIGDVHGARKSCRACHEAYKARYEEQFRLRPVSAP